MDEFYSTLLHNAAERWGFTVMNGKPIIGLPPTDEGTGRGIVGNPYVAEPLPSAEELTYKDGRIHLRISLFTLNGRWGFSLGYQNYGFGIGYGNFLKFCIPYPDRISALEAVFEKLRQYGVNDPHALSWAREQSQPQQLMMFEI